MIRFENIQKRYKQQIVLSGISFEIKKGELVVLIGASGCGKTTSLKMINKLIRPTAGKIYINGEDIEKKNDIDLRRNIGYVIQQTGLFPHMTVRENIEIIPKLQKENEEMRGKKTLAMMNMVGLEEEYLDRYPTQLSGGQQQRIGVARAFMCDPDIILMDEPFSALDPITRAQLQDKLVELQAKLKKTIVFVTHDMDEAIKLADRICIMKEGKIAQYDTPEEILKNPADDFVSDFVGKNRIWTAPELIRAKDIMIQNAICGTAEITVAKGIERMRRQSVDSLVIIDDSRHVLGSIKAMQAQLVKDKTIEIGQAMQVDIQKASPEDSIVDILNLVNDNDLSNMIVVDENNVLQGLITKSSLITTLSQQYIDEEEA